MINNIIKIINYYNIIGCNYTYIQVQYECIRFMYIFHQKHTNVPFMYV